MYSVGFGGGCHWCTEAVFQSLRGVSKVRQGFIRSDPPNDGWSEGVEIIFDPGVITLKDLISIHLATHASTSDHAMRGKYRSAVYATDPQQAATAERVLHELEVESGVRFVTHVLHNRGFKSSDHRFHNYYANDPKRPFCQAYIDPKLTKLRARFPKLLKSNISDRSSLAE